MQVSVFTGGVELPKPGDRIRFREQLEVWRVEAFNPIDGQHFLASEENGTENGSWHLLKKYSFEKKKFVGKGDPWTQVFFERDVDPETDGSYAIRAFDVRGGSFVVQAFDLPKDLEVLWSKSALLVTWANSFTVMGADGDGHLAKEIGRALNGQTIDSRNNSVERRVVVLTPSNSNELVGVCMAAPSRRSVQMRMLGVAETERQKGLALVMYEELQMCGMSEGQEVLVQLEECMGELGRPWWLRQGFRGEEKANGVMEQMSGKALGRKEIEMRREATWAKRGGGGVDSAPGGSGGGFSLTLLDRKDAEFKRILDKLNASLQNVVRGAVRVWHVENPPLRERYDAAKALLGGDEKELWHSTTTYKDGDTKRFDPVDICRDGFDPEGEDGCYGEGVYFAEHALYCDFFMKPPTQVRVNGKPEENGCFLIMADVALGQCKHFGEEISDETTYTPAGFDSRSGTEGNLKDKEDLKVGGVAAAVQESKRDRQDDSCRRRDALELGKHGQHYGMQYVVDSKERAFPKYLVKYQRDQDKGGPRDPPPGPDRPPDDGAGGGSGGDADAHGPGGGRGGSASNRRRGDTQASSGSGGSTLGASHAGSRTRNSVRVASDGTRPGPSHARSLDPRHAHPRVDPPTRADGRRDALPAARCRPRRAAFGQRRVCWRSGGRRFEQHICSL